MNILPKKSWHVRNKDNIERVRKDEEKAAEEEKERLKRVAIAESEARTDLLRQKAHQRCTEVQSSVTASSSQQHINFFEEFEKGKKVVGKNVEHEQEERQEKERQEKAIGLLTYLGQGSVELEANKPWYFKPPEKRSSEQESTGLSKSKDEFDAKRKRSADPMKDMMTFIDQSKKVRMVKEGQSHQDLDRRVHRKHHGSDKKNSSKSLDELRAERIRREQAERVRTEQLLAKLRGDVKPQNADPINDDRQRRYNSQFNPDIARVRFRDNPS